MQHDQVIDIMRRAVRSRICPRCFRRKPFPDGTDTDEPRPASSRLCEPECNIFCNLPVLMTISADSSRDQTLDYESEIKNRICQECTATPTSGDFCEDHSTRDCVLARYALEVGELMDETLAASKHGRTGGH